MILSLSRWEIILKEENKSRTRGRGLRKENDLEQWMKPERRKGSGLVMIS
jgi:hypothetical protein